MQTIHTSIQLFIGHMDKGNFGKFRLNADKLKCLLSLFIYQKFNKHRIRLFQVIDCEICIISKTIHSNEIVRVSHKSNGGTEIFKYCCENNKWMSCGVLQAEYSISSSFFIFFNYDI